MVVDDFFSKFSSGMLQNILVFLIVGAAVFYLTKKIISSFKISGCKSGCSSCSLVNELNKAKK